MTGRADAPLNALLFERIAERWAGGSTSLRLLLTVVPLVAEALLLVVAAQTGFSDGPRILGALAADRFVPKSLVRLNARLAPERGVYVTGAIAFAATLLSGGRLAPLLTVFVTCVFVTVSVSQAVMLWDALGRAGGPRSWRGVVVHASALALAAVILVGTVVTQLRTGSLAVLVALAALVALCLAVRRRQTALTQAKEALEDEEATGDMAPFTPPAAPVLAEARWLVLLVGETVGFVKHALAWVARNADRVVGVTLATVALVDGESIHDQANIRAVEERLRRRLEEVARQARGRGLEVDVEVHRAAELVAGAVAVAADVLRRRPGPGLVVGWRLAPSPSRLDFLIRDDVTGRIAARLDDEGLAMIVLEVPSRAPAVASTRAEDHRS